jgi:nucleotide-binding universal stress UspA family protein
MKQDLEQSNSLTDLAARIRAEHDAVGEALRNSVQHAIAAGELLIEAKNQIEHGQWLPWLRDHCGVSERSAQRYIRLARNKVQLANTTCVSDLSLNGALALLTVPRDTLHDDLVDVVVGSLDLEQILANAARSEAETARRAVVLDEAERNVEAMDEIIEKLGIRRGNPGADEIEQIAAEYFGIDFKEYCSTYAEAVASDDYDAAFAIAEHLRDWTVNTLEMGNKLAKAALGSTQ